MLAVLLPVLSILLTTLLLVPALAMQKQHGEVHHEEVSEDHAPALCLGRDNIVAVAVAREVRIALRSGNRVRSSVAHHVASERGGQDVRPRHEPVAEVVDVARCAPPAGD